jgi:hypothetical protein
MGAFASFARMPVPHPSQTHLHRIKLKKTLVKQNENELDSSYLERKMDTNINDMVNTAVKTPQLTKIMMERIRKYDSSRGHSSLSCHEWTDSTQLGTRKSQDVS